MTPRKDLKWAGTFGTCVEMEPQGYQPIEHREGCVGVPLASFPGPTREFVLFNPLLDANDQILVPGY